MTGGHFIWIWADTSTTAEFFQPNSVPSLDEKDQILNTKPNYDSTLEEFVERKAKYDNFEGGPTERQYYQQHYSGNKRPQQNSTRYKSLNTNSNRFHHIIGLTKPGDELTGDASLPSILPDKSFLKNDKFTSGMSTGQVQIKEKRTSRRFSRNSGEDMKDDTNPSDNDYTSSLENGRASNGNLNIKNINSHEFNANYYDPYLPSRREGGSDNGDNVFDGESDESTNEENSYYDYDKVNPFQSNTEATSATFTTTTRRSMSDISTTKNFEKSKTNKSQSSNRNNRNKVDHNKTPPHVEQPTTIPYSKFFDESDDLDLESYSELSIELKAKRADNFPSTFNISSHVFFHHFKDFPVGLLALRHIKMNIDRVFVRSAIRLFASTWSRVEKDEELRQASGGKLGGRKNNWNDNWTPNENDYDEVNNNFRNKKQKNKTNINMNSRQSNARGSKKYKRDAQEAKAKNVVQATQTTIPHLVNSSNKTSNSNSKLINDLTNRNYSQHVSDLNSHPSDRANKSNNDNTRIKKYNLTTNSNVSKLLVNETASLQNVNQESVDELTVAGKIEIQKRQNSWWSDTVRGRNQEKTKAARGTPQYKGGCFGSPSRSDLKRSELFARFVWKLQLNVFFKIFFSFGQISARSCHHGTIWKDTPWSDGGKSSDIKL